MRATSGVCAGYVVHSLLVAFGLAAVIAASPVIFETLRWAGVLYLAYLALQLLRSAMKPRVAQLPKKQIAHQFGKGFLTAALNPKGMMIYFAILPQFMRGGESAAWQALMLSAIFIALCGLFYTVLSIVIAATGHAGGLSDRRRRCVEGVSGGFLVIAAGRLASS